ncbi:MAG TPA: MDR family MFS transporter [Stellaceae bacterium]|nr:MDR family MFS transporter [Stellaceae bacterium]
MAASHREILRILSGVMLGMFLAALDQTIITTALPTMAAELGGVEHLSWVVSIYLLTATVSTPIYGKLSDLYGRRPLLFTAIAIFLVGSALAALAQTMPQLIGARGLQGLGGGGLITLAQTVIADHVSPRERGRYQAYMGGVWATASIGGPMLGGFFVDHLSWRWVFWINLPVGAGALLLCWLALRHLPQHYERRSIDYLGAVLLTLGVTALLLVATWGGSQFPWLSPEILGLSAAGVVLLSIFALQELRASEPILPPRLFRNDIFRAANGCASVVSMVTFGTMMLLPIYLQLAAGMSAGRSGLLMAPLTGASVIGAFSSGQIMRHRGRYKLQPLVGLSLATLALILLALMPTDAPATLISLALALFGVGVGASFPVMLVAIQNAADPRDIGAATSAVNFFRSMGGSFGAAVLWSVLIIALTRKLASSGGTTVPENAIGLLQGGAEAFTSLSPALKATLLPALGSAFHVVFAIAAVLNLLALAIASVLREQPLRTTPAGSALRQQPEHLSAD